MNDRMTEWEILHVHVCRNWMTDTEYVRHVTETVCGNWMGDTG